MCSGWNEYGYEWPEFNLHSVSTTYYWAIYLISQCLHFLFWKMGIKHAPNEDGKKYGKCPARAGHRWMSHWAAVPSFTHLCGYQSSWVAVLLKTHNQSHWRNQEPEEESQCLLSTIPVPYLLLDILCAVPKAFSHLRCLICQLHIVKV